MTSACVPAPDSEVIRKQLENLNDESILRMARTGFAGIHLDEPWWSHAKTSDLQSVFMSLSPQQNLTRYLLAPLEQHGFTPMWMEHQRDFAQFSAPFGRQNRNELLQWEREIRNSALLVCDWEPKAPHAMHWIELARAASIPVIILTAKSDLDQLWWLRDEDPLVQVLDRGDDKLRDSFSSSLQKIRRLLGFGHPEIQHPVKGTYWLSNLCERQNITMEQLSDRIHLDIDRLRVMDASPPHLANPSYVQLRQLAAALDVRFDDLLASVAPQEKRREP